MKIPVSSSPPPPPAQPYFPCPTTDIAVRLNRGDYTMCTSPNVDLEAGYGEAVEAECAHRPRGCSCRRVMERLWRSMRFIGATVIAGFLSGLGIRTVARSARGTGRFVYRHNN